MPPRSRTTLPLVQPIVPVLRGAAFDDPEWLFEPKYDGFRGLLYVGSRDVHFRSKRGNVMTRFQPLAEQVRDELRVRSARTLRISMYFTGSEHSGGLRYVHT